MADNIIFDRGEWFWIYDDLPPRCWSTRRMAEVHRQLALDKRARILGRPLTHSESKLSATELEVLRFEADANEIMEQMRNNND